ncbi:MAG: sigma-70 family RNA polymerase sigma factor [Kofleriaceae bacterium]|nr:sigma-70 family RNA polymerase sigma factor [Kofleriaceae bacterium]
MGLTLVRDPWDLVVLSSAPRDRPTPVPVRLDAAQLDACRRGDRGALEAVFRAHAQDLARVLVRVVGPGAHVEDLLQDTFAEAITAFARFRGEASVKTWLTRIAINVAHQHLRRPRHRREIAVDEPPEQASEPLTAEAFAMSKKLYALLDELDADRRIALVLFAIEEHTVEEIAALMGASVTATRSRIFRARRALMKAMRNDPAFALRGGT